jgi:hypothetical protein
MDITSTIQKYNDLSIRDRLLLFMWRDAIELEPIAGVTLVAKATDLQDNPIVFVKMLRVDDVLVITGFFVTPWTSPQVAEVAGEVIDSQLEIYIHQTDCPIKRLLVIVNGECQELRTYTRNISQNAVMGLGIENSKPAATYLN